MPWRTCCGDWSDSCRHSVCCWIKSCRTVKTAMCSVNDIKKARYTVQVMTPVLYALLKNAYKEDNNNTGSPNFDNWLTEKNIPASMKQMKFSETS